MIRIRGHRGAAALAPENTFQSFERAIEEEVYSIEFDVRRTKDDELVLIHDETVDRTTDGSGTVRELTYDEIAALDAGNGAHVPTLDDALTYLSQHDVPEIRLEIKEADTTEDVYRHVADAGLLDRTVFHSFSMDALYTLQRLNPDAQTSATTVEPSNDFLETAEDAGCDIVTLHYGHTSASYVEAAREYGFKVDLWDVEGEENIRSAYRLQPDYIGADDPVLAKQVLTMLEQEQPETEGYA